jgi:hypothetical protein
MKPDMKPENNFELIENDIVLCDDNTITNITIIWYKDFFKIPENEDLIIELINMFDEHNIILKHPNMWAVTMSHISIVDLNDLIQEIKLLSMPCEIKITL